MPLLLRALESPPFKALLYLQRALLSPVISGSFLLVLIAAPESVRLAVLRKLSLPPTLDVGVAKTVLQVLLSLGLVRVVNDVLNSMAANCGRLRAARGWDWPNEIAVVTGGCSGIGYGVVKKLVRRHITVAILDVQDLPKSFENHHLVHFYKCDITSPESVAEAADAIRRDLGHPSILINNAGITAPVPILKISQEFLHKIFDVNCLSHWTTVQQFLPRMIQLNKGHVVTVASTASFVSLARAADYSATKAAALSFHESLATELKTSYKADSVLTSVVQTNFVKTPLVEPFADKLEAEGIRFLTPEQVSDAIVGQILSRRGGQLIIPNHMASLSGIRGWPTWLQVKVRDAMGSAAANWEV